MNEQMDRRGGPASWRRISILRPWDHVLRIVSQGLIGNGQLPVRHLAAGGPEGTVLPQLDLSGIVSGQMVRFHAAFGDD